MDELGALPSPSNDVTDTDKEEPRELAHLGRLLLAGMRARSLSERPEERKRVRAQLADALAALADEEAAGAEPIMITLSPGWMERVLHKVADLEARGPTSRERPRRPPRDP